MSTDVQILDKTELEAYNDLRIILAQKLKQQILNLDLKFEINNTEIDFLLSNYEQLKNGWHFGKTFIKNKNHNEYIYLTRIKSNLNNVQNYNYIHNEVKEINEELVLATTIILENNEILQKIVYFDANNEFKTNFTYNKNLEEYYSSLKPIVIDKNILKTETKNKLTNLTDDENQDFEVESNSYEDKEATEQEASCSKNWKFVWWGIKALAFISCVVLSAILGFIPTAIVAGVGALKLSVICITVALGFIGLPWKTIQNKAMEWIFGIKKKDPIEQIKKLEEKLKKEQAKNEKKWQRKLDKESKKNQEEKEKLTKENQDVTKKLNFVTQYFNLGKIMRWKEKATKSFSDIINEFQIEKQENKFEKNIINNQIEITKPKTLQEKERLSCPKTNPQICPHI